MGVPATLVLTLTLNVALRTPSEDQKADPNFQYGTTQAIVALSVIILSLTITVFSMILGQRYQPKALEIVRENGSTNVEDESMETGEISDEEPLQESSVEIEDLLLPQNSTRNCGGTGRYRSDSKHRQYCLGLIRIY